MSRFPAPFAARQLRQHASARRPRKKSTAVARKRAPWMSAFHSGSIAWHPGPASRAADLGTAESGPGRARDRNSHDRIELGDDDQLSIAAHDERACAAKPEVIEDRDGHDSLDQIIVADVLHHSIEGIRLAARVVEPRDEGTVDRVHRVGTAFVAVELRRRLSGKNHSCPHATENLFVLLTAPKMPRRLRHATA